MMVPATVVACDKAAVELKVALLAGGRVNVPEPVNGVETPFAITVPLKVTLELKPLVSMPLMPACKLKVSDGGGGGGCVVLGGDV
jgi:hypothetical protein